MEDEDYIPDEANYGQLSSILQFIKDKNQSGKLNFVQEELINFEEKVLPMQLGKVEEEMIKFLAEKNMNLVEIQRIAARGFGKGDLSLDYIKKCYEGKDIKKGLCRKTLTFQDVGYSCLDCQKDPTCIICKECFENGDHKGHRCFLKQNIGGMCDCGDEEAWNKEGNCKNHTGYVEEDNYVDEETKTNIQRSIKQVSITIFRALEIAIKMKSEATIKYLGRLLANFLSFLEEFCEKYPTMVPIVAKAVYSPLSSDFEQEVYFQHNENDHSGRIKIIKPRVNNSSLISLILRYNLVFDNQMQKKFCDFFISMFTDNKFKLSFAPKYIQALNFFLNWDDCKYFSLKEKKFSKLFSINIQILTSDIFSAEAIKCNDMVYVIDSFIEWVETYRQINGEGIYDEGFSHNVSKFSFLDFANS